jgi:hypothetical protein
LQINRTTPPAEHTLHQDWAKLGSFARLLPAWTVFRRAGALSAAAQPVSWVFGGSELSHGKASSKGSSDLIEFDGRYAT